MPQTAPPRLHFLVPPEPSHLRRARERIRDYLLQNCSERQVSEDLVTCIEEAATNVIRHSGSNEHFEISLAFEDGNLIVEVRDHGAGFEIAGFDPNVVPDVMSDHGRGLFLISRLCDEMKLQRDGGLVVRMVKKGAATCELPSFESGLELGAAEGSDRDMRLRVMLEELDEAFIALDWEYRFVHANEVALRLMDTSREEILGKRPRDLWPASADSPASKAFREAMELGRPLTIEQHSVISDAWQEVRVYPTSVGISVYIREINERKRKELERNELVAALHESEERYRTIVEASSEGITIGSPDGVFVFANQRMAEMLGYSVDELTGMSGSEAIFEGWEPEQTEARTELHTGQVLRREIKLRRKDGTSLWSRYSATPMFDAMGEHVANLIMHSDITEAKLAEEALRESEEKYRTIVETAAEGVMVARPDGAYIYLNQRMADMLGYPIDEVLGKSIHDLTSDDRLLAQVLSARDELGQGDAARGEMEFRRKDGTSLRTMYSISALRDANGAHIGNLAMHTDITERKLAEEALKRLADLLDLSLEPIVVWRLGGVIETWNRGAEQLYGYSATEALGQITHELLHTTHPQPWASIEKTLRKRGSWEGELVHRAKDGHEVTVLSRHQLIVGSDRLERVLEANRDISERKRAEQALRESESKFRTLFDTMSEGFALDEIICDDNGKPCDLRYLSVNPAFERHTGMKAADIVGHTTLELFPEAEPEWFEVYGRVALTGEPTHFEAQFGPLGRWFEVSAYQTEPGRFATVFVDVTEHRRLEEALRGAEAEAKDLIRYAPTGIYEINFRGPGFKNVNDAMCALSGYEREELLAMNPSDLLDQESRALFAERIKKGLAGEPLPQQVEYRFMTKDGRLRDVVLNTTFTETNGVVDGALVVGYDVTERKGAEAALRDSEERFRGFVSASSDVVYRMSPDWTEMRHLQGREFISDTDDSSSTWLDKYIHPEDKPSVLTAIAEAIRTKNTFELEYRVRTVDGTLGWVHSRAVPLLDGAGEIVEWFGTASDITARKQAEEAMRASELRLQQELETTVLLSEAAGSITQSLTLNEVLDRLARIILDLGGQTRATISLWQEREGRLEVVSSVGEPGVPIGRQVSLEELSEPARRAVREKRSTLIDYDALEPGQRGVGDRISSHLALDVPLYFEDRLVGLIAVDDPAERREFSARERRLVEGIGAQAAIALEHARLHDEFAARERFNAALNEINALIHSTLRAEEIMQRVVAHAVDVVGADSAMVALKHGDDWIAEYGHPEVPGVIHESVRSDEAPFMITAVEERVPVAIDDCETDPRCIPEVQRRFGVRSVLCMPLIARDEVLGVIFFNHHRAAVRFDPQTVDFAGQLAVAISSALENATLYEAQRRIAETLQKNFIHELPTVAGLELGVVSQTAFEPELVGGDFSDVFVADESHVVVLIGDVAGKGVHAAGMTETVRSTVRALAAVDCSPDYILAKTNELLLKFDPEEPHVTAFLGVLDPRTGHLNYASAGHPAPVHLGAFSVQPLDVAFGPPLGSFDLPYTRAHAGLTLEDYLVLYTDGVTEARRDRELLGDERLLEIVAGLRGRSAQEVADGVRDAALAFAGHLRDDLQVIVLRLA